MNGEKDNDESKANNGDAGESDGDSEVEEIKAEGEGEGEAREENANATEDDDDDDGDDSYEEECVICLEALSDHPWGRCTPCNHAFHKKCWWEWENAHNERVAQRPPTANRRDPDRGPKCCLCNTVNEQFVDGTGDEPAHNPSPYVASEDPGGTETGGRFSNWIREMSEEASGFIEFLANDLRESGAFPFNVGPPIRGRSNRNNNTAGRSSSGRASSSTTGSSANNRRRSSRGFNPFFGRNVGTSSSTNSGGANASPNSSATSPPFLGIPPIFGNQSSARFRRSSTGTGARRNNAGGTNVNINPFNQMRPGTRVITQHLVNSPNLNGRRGSVVQYQPQSGRYLVQLESDIASIISGEHRTSPVAIKPANLLQTGVKVKIHGLQSQPRLNGKEGTVSAYSHERNRYVVEVGASLFSSPREISIKPINIRIPNGMCVRLEGLQRTPQWNGKYGTIAGWVEDESGESGSARYEVRLSRQYAVRVKMENVRL